MRRIVLAGDDLQDFPMQQESAHIKAIFPRDNEQLPKLGMYMGAKKWMRSYTVRHFDTLSKHLTIDFAVNDHTGLAANWAAKAIPGDYLGIAGPGETKHTNYDADL
jgi:NADPH-dependent ferric siderophore reductase